MLTTTKKVSGCKPGGCHQKTSPDQEGIRVNIFQDVGENTVQTVVQGIVPIPPEKPDPAKVVSATGSARINNVDIIPGKVIVQGTLHLQIVYVADEPCQPVHHVQGDLQFADFLDIKGAEPGMDVKASVDVEHVNATLDPECSRVLKAAGVLKISVKVKESHHIHVLTTKTLPTGVTANREKLNLQVVMKEISKQDLVSDIVRIPPQKPNPKKILEVTVKEIITDQIIIDNKIIITGFIELQILYVGDVPEQSVHEVQFLIPFTEFIEVPGVTPEMDVEISALIEFLAAKIDPNLPSSNRVRIDAVLLVTAKISQTRELEIITGVTGAQAETVQVRQEQVIGQETAEVIIKDIFEIPPQKPCPQKILSTTVDQIDVTDVDIIENKVVIGGSVNSQVLYVADEPSQPVHDVHRISTFRQFVDVPGVMPGMDAEVHASVEFVAAVFKDCQIDLTIIIKLDVRVLKIIQKDVVTKILS